MDKIASVALFFVSRIDTKADTRPEADSPAHGQVALASARVAYRRDQAKFTGLETAS